MALTRSLRCVRSSATTVRHFIPRSAGGLGIEENGLTLCFDCHYAFDHTPQRAELRQHLKAYLQECYPDWNEDALRYKKYACFE